MRAATLYRGDSKSRSVSIARAKAAPIQTPATKRGEYQRGRVRTAVPAYRSTNGGMNITPARLTLCQKPESSVFQRYSGKHQRKIRNDRSAKAQASRSFFAQTLRYPAIARATIAATRLPCE